MIIESLCDYYDLLASAGKAVKPGYSIANITCVFDLDKEGNLTGIEMLDRSKMTVPRQDGRSNNTAPYFLSDTSAYFLGLSNNQKQDRASRCLQASAELHKNLLSGINCTPAKAVLGFFDKTASNLASDVFSSSRDAVVDCGYIVFRVEGAFAHEDAEIRQAWENREATSGTSGFCIGKGETDVLCKKHPAVRGVPNTMTLGAKLVSFNAESSISYNRDFAPIGEDSAFKYTEALSYLLRDDRHRIYLGKMVLVFWANTEDESYCTTFMRLLAPAWDGTDDDFIRELKESALPPDVDFFVLGLTGEITRISVGLFVHDKYSQIVKNILYHHRRMEQPHSPSQPDYITIKLILKAAGVRGEYPQPALIAATIRAILQGRPYPVLLQRQVQQNAMLPGNEVTYVDAAIIGACLYDKGFGQK